MFYVITRIFLYVMRRNLIFKAKEKFQGKFKIQKSGDKTSSGDIGLDIRTHASTKVGQDEVEINSRLALQ